MKIKDLLKVFDALDCEVLEFRIHKSDVLEKTYINIELQNKKEEETL